jgi:hypothetical protein
MCVCVYSVFRYRPCDELITRPRSPTVCKNNHETEKEARAQGAVEPVKKKIHEITSGSHLEPYEFSPHSPVLI